MKTKNGFASSFQGSRGLWWALGVTLLSLCLTSTAFAGKNSKTGTITVTFQGPSGVNSVFADVKMCSTASCTGHNVKIMDCVGLTSTGLPRTDTCGSGGEWKGIEYTIMDNTTGAQMNCSPVSPVPLGTTVTCDNSTTLIVQ